MILAVLTFVFTLTMIASSRTGERRTSIPAEAKFFVVLVFIIKVTVGERMSVLSPE